jgi:hypothetical protein
VRFRCVPIYPDLSAYYGTMDVFVISPPGVIVKRWENVQTNAGDFQTSDCPKTDDK